MLTIFIVFTVAIVAFTLLGIGYSRLLSRIVQNIITGRLREAELIIETGKVPEGWMKPYTKEISALLSGSLPARRIERMASRCKNDILKRMAALIQYFSKASCFESEEAKSFFLEKLNGIHADWQDANFERVLREERGTL